MRFVPLELESKLRQKHLWPESWTARAGIYVLTLDLLFFLLQLITVKLLPRVSASLGGWVTFLSVLAIVLFTIVGFRFLRSQLLWRLRNRLIVTYMFIGVIPVLLLVIISGLTLYLLAGQFANFVVTSEIDTHLRAMQASTRAMASELALQSAGDAPLNMQSMNGIRQHDPDWARRQVCAWAEGHANPVCSGPAAVAPFAAPAFLHQDFRGIVRDQGALFLRSATVAKSNSGELLVISSEPLDRFFVEEIASDIGEIVISRRMQFSSSNQQVSLALSSGAVPPASTAFDRQITFGAPLPVLEWATGKREGDDLLVRVETRPSVLYVRLFASLGDFAQGVEYILLAIAIIFAVIELLALFIGTRLTRSITSAVAQLYEATRHVNRADFSHRITVRSSDQLASLANSFNSMTTSIERLIVEQKEKQRLENELTIAQEVQAQLFPKQISQLETLEVHGFCRPARTVSGDYYDFLALNADKLILAVGDISGKGISAALLMATIHSAVRAYSLEGVPLLQQPAAVGAAAGPGLMLASKLKGAEVSASNLLALLNHQLYASTPQEKYATLFLGIYDGLARRLTYSNGGHLPPILLSEDGASERLSCGGTVVGLFDHENFPEATVQLRRGDIFIAYSDGVTEPENDYGEFGEERLIQIVKENRHLPLARITELVTAAVDDWIGDNEQPDDVTLVLARAR